MAQELGLARSTATRWDALQAIGWSIQAPRPKTRPRPARRAGHLQLADRSRRRRGTPSRPPGRALLHGRAPHRAEAGHPPVCGHAAEAHCARPSSLRVALRHRLRRAGHRREHWYVGNGVSKPCSSVCWPFAREAGAGPQRTIILLLDGAGWHTERDCTCRTVCGSSTCRPTPELQPAEHLWQLVDEPIASDFSRLAEIQDRIEQRCRDSKLNPTSCEPTPSFVGGPHPHRPN